jgi:hypothetical protein
MVRGGRLALLKTKSGWWRSYETCILAVFEGFNGGRTKFGRCLYGELLKRAARAIE